MKAEKMEPPTESGSPIWGSDLIALAIREIGAPYVCLVPGASFRGIHDSIVNFLGNKDPQIVVCLHEEHAVSIAHGYAKVTGEPMPVLLHSNVGLLHASMSIFNAWCDRVPLVAIGATGPLDAAKRRPWIDWIHTSIDQGSVVRGFVKWDDQPASPAASVEAIRRGTMISRTRPCGPVYINIDSTVQEGKLTGTSKLRSADLYQPAHMAAPDPHDVEEAVKMIAKSKRPIILSGRTSRCQTAWRQRIEFAERLGATVFGEYNSAGSFPRSHSLYGKTLKFSLKGAVPKQLQSADLVISLDWTDLGGTVDQIWPSDEGRPSIIAVSNDQIIHRGWNMDYQQLAPAELRVGTTPEAFVGALLDAEPAEIRREVTSPPVIAKDRTSSARQDGLSSVMSMTALAQSFHSLTRDMRITLVSHPLTWPVHTVRCDDPLDFLGSNGGGGLGAGPGIAIGAAMALRQHEPQRLPIAILGDGDFLMGANALWTAAQQKVPVLFIIANNRSYLNDETHQAQVARMRDRPVENRWIGQRLSDPPPDLAALARGQGVAAVGPIETLDKFEGAFDAALNVVRNGSPFVIDALVQQETIE